MKKRIDYILVRDLSLNMENEGRIYEKEGFLAKNYARKYNKGKFNFAKGYKGVKNLIVVPYVRNYQKQWGIKIGNPEREALTKSRMRAVMRRLRE